MADSPVGFILTAQDNASGAIARVHSGLMGLGSSGGIASGALGTLGKVAHGVEGGLAHAKNAITGLLTGPLGLLGLAGGVLSIGGIFEATVGKVTNLGLVLRNLMAVTHDSPENLSALIAVFDKFGISADTTATMLDRLTANVGKITVTSKSAATFVKEFGFNLHNANGTVADTNTLILRAADYFSSKTIPQTEKAALMTKLFGRTWMDLAPVLALGSKGLLQAEAGAKALGEVLTAQNATDLKNYTINMDNLHQTLGGLATQVGLTLVPALSNVAVAVTGFLQKGGAKDIETFVGNLLSMGQGIAATFTGKIVPAISGIVGTIQSMWAQIPKPLQDLLVKGAVAQIASSAIFGSGPLQWGADIAKGILGGIGGLAGKLIGGVGGGVVGHLAPQDVFVTNWAMIGGGGGGGLLDDLAAAGAGGLGVVGGIAAALGGVIALAATGPIHDIENAISGFFGGKPLNYYQGPPGSNPFTTSVTPGSSPARPVPGAIGEHSAAGSRMVDALNAQQKDAQRTAVAVEAMKAAEATSASSQLSALADIRGQLASMPVPHVTVNNQISIREILRAGLVVTTLNVHPQGSTAF